MSRSIEIEMEGEYALLLSDCWLILEWTQLLTITLRFKWRVRVAVQLLSGDYCLADPRVDPNRIAPYSKRV
jgi:hypothetical protein